MDGSWWWFGSMMLMIWHCQNKCIDCHHHPRISSSNTYNICKYTMSYVIITIIITVLTFGQASRAIWPTYSWKQGLFHWTQKIVAVGTAVMFSSWRLAPLVTSRDKILRGSNSSPWHQQPRYHFTPEWHHRNSDWIWWNPSSNDASRGHDWRDMTGLIWVPLGIWLQGETFAWTHWSLLVS